MKKIFTLLVVLSFTTVLFAQMKITEAGIKEINYFNNFRMELTEFQDNKAEAVKRIEEYKSKDPWKNLNEQEKLIMLNLYEMEIYNYIWEDKANEAKLEKTFSHLIELNEAFIDKNEADVSDWLYIQTADSYSCYMSYNPVSGALKYGTRLKKLYEKSVELNPENIYGLSHLAQWYYWAPGISGGSKKKALSYFEKAVSVAKSESDKFYAEIFYSQILFDLENKDNSKKHLDIASNIYPKSEYTKELAKHNEEGYSLFTYNKHKSEVENGTETH